MILFYPPIDDADQTNFTFLLVNYTLKDIRHLVWSEINMADTKDSTKSQALVSFKKYMPPPLPYFKVNICPLPLPHFASIFFAYLWSFHWPNYIVTLPRYFSFRLPHLNINTGPPSNELDKNIQRKSHFLFFSQWNGYSHFRSVLNWFRNKQEKVL
jgi:hypothetical protein